MADRNVGIPGWRPPHADAAGRRPAYGRSIAWAVVAWVATIALVYVVAQVLGIPQVGGWLGLAGFLVGYWIGGTRGGIKGRQEWLQFIVILSALAFLAFGFGACLGAMIAYG